MDNPLITLVVPCHDYADKVGRAIDSVKQQTYTNLECFVVDDDSADNSKEVILNFISDDPRFHYEYVNFHNVAMVRNYGISLGSGKYVVCLDADDALAPTFVSALLPALEANRSLGVAYSGLHYILPNGKEGQSPWPAEFNPDHQISGFNQIPTACLFRRTMWERLGGYQPRCCPRGAGFEDADFWTRATEHGWGAIQATTEPLFIYSWMSGRVSSDNVHDGKIEEIEYYKTWYPWFTDGHRLFASLATPAKYSHPVRQYDEPGVSVVIPVGPNHLDLLPQALDSLESQTYRKWEAIVVLDSGQDEPNLPAIQKAYPYIRWEYTSHRGAGYARNRGAELARAPLLLFLDADDWLYPEFLSKTLQAHTDYGYAIYTDYIGIADVSDLDQLAPKLRDRVKQYDGSRAWMVHQAFDFDCNRASRQPEDPPWLWCNITTLIRTSWHFQIGGFDESMPSWEDYLYWVRMARSGICFERLPEPLMVYRFYTGERRDYAHRGQNWSNMLQYVKKVVESEENVGCRGCGKRTSVPSRDVQVLPTTRGVSTMNQVDSNFRMCLYRHRNIGDHKVSSVVPEIEARGGYGYRADGDRFLVHVDDVQAKPDKFIVEEIKLPSMSAKSVGAPQPVTMADIAADEDPLVKLARVKAEARAAVEAELAKARVIEESKQPNEASTQAGPPKKTRTRRVKNVKSD